MELERAAVEQLDRAALVALVLAQQARIGALEGQVAALTARVDELGACPDCGAALGGGAVVRRRQVLHIPPAPVEVIEHVARRRVCPQCGRSHTPPLALGAAVYGQQRLSTDTLAY